MGAVMGQALDVAPMLGERLVPSLAPWPRGGQPASEPPPGRSAHRDHLYHCLVLLPPALL